MLRNTLAIAKNTFRETVRDRILVAGFFVIIAIILFNVFLGSISLGETSRILANFGVTAIYLLQMFVAIFIGSMLMYKEIERKTFYLLLPKPITRTEILLGKLLGLTATILSVSMMATFFLLIILMMQGAFAYAGFIIVSVLMSVLEAMLLVVVSMFFSSFTSPVLAAISTLVIYMVGHAGLTLKTIFMTTSSTLLEVITRAIYYLLPNLEKFNLRNDITQPAFVSPTLLLISVVYGVIYIVFLLLLTLVVFKKRDF